AHILQRLAPDQGAVGLQDGPEREDAHMVQAQGCDGLEIAADLGRVQVQPGVEPALAWYVVDAEAWCGVHPLIPPCSRPFMKYRWSAMKKMMIGMTAKIGRASCRARVECGSV